MNIAPLCLNYNLADLLLGIVSSQSSNRKEDIRVDLKGHIHEHTYHIIP
jgi:hypothetical protein